MAVTDRIDEVAAWFNGDRHSSLQVPRCPKAPNSRLVNSLHALHAATRSPSAPYSHICTTRKIGIQICPATYGKK